MGGSHSCAQSTETFHRLFSCYSCDKITSGCRGFHPPPRSRRRDPQLSLPSIPLSLPCQLPCRPESRYRTLDHSLRPQSEASTRAVRRRLTFTANGSLMQTASSLSGGFTVCRSFLRPCCLRFTGSLPAWLPSGEVPSVFRGTMIQPRFPASCFPVFRVVAPTKRT